MKSHIFYSLILSATLAAMPAHAQNTLNEIDLQTALAEVSFISDSPTPERLRQRHNRAATAGAQLPLNERLSTRIMLGYEQAGFTRSDDQWVSSIGLTYRFSY